MADSSNNTRLRLVIFDCDGVMFDSLEANKIYYNQLLVGLGHQPMDSAELEYVHSHNVMDSVDHIFRHYPASEIKAAHQFRKRLNYEQYLQYMIIEPDLKEFLNFLRPDYFTAISTNRTTSLPSIMKMFELEALFDKVVTAMDVERPKPHPEALVKILDHFGLTAEEAIFIGDSMVDHEHAASMGIRLIAFKNPDLPTEIHVNSFMEISRLDFFKNRR